MYFDPYRGIVLTLLDAEEGTAMKRLKTPCGVVLSPVSRAQVILLPEDDLNLVYDAIYGQLPDGTVVLGVMNASETFPEDAMSVKVRIVLEPYQKGMEPQVLDPKLAAWGGGCPVCGKLSEEDLQDIEDMDDDEDEDGGEGRDDDHEGGDEDEDTDDWAPGGDEEEEPVEVPMPRRFIYDRIVGASKN